MYEQWRQDLCAAANIIEPEGCWTQQGFSVSFGALNPGGEREAWSAYGAIHEAVRQDLGRPHFLALTRGDKFRIGFAANAVARFCGKTRCIILWNLEPERTQADVVEVLRRAADEELILSPAVENSMRIWAR